MQGKATSIGGVTLASFHFIYSQQLISSLSYITLLNYLKLGLTLSGSLRVFSKPEQRETKTNKTKQKDKGSWSSTWMVDGSAPDKIARFQSVPRNALCTIRIKIARRLARSLGGSVGRSRS